MDKDEKILRNYGATDIKSYCLISNYGFTFKLNGIKYDARLWNNCYGMYLGWKIDICECATDETRDIIKGNVETLKKICTELNAE